MTLRRRWISKSTASKFHLVRFCLRSLLSMALIQPPRAPSFYQKSLKYGSTVWDVDKQERCVPIRRGSLQFNSLERVQRFRVRSSDHDARRGSAINSGLYEQFPSPFSAGSADALRGTLCMRSRGYTCALISIGHEVCSSVACGVTSYREACTEVD